MQQSRFFYNRTLYHKLRAKESTSTTPINHISAQASADNFNHSDVKYIHFKYFFSSFYPGVQIGMAIQLGLISIYACHDTEKSHGRRRLSPVSINQCKHCGPKPGKVVRAGSFSLYLLTGLYHGRVQIKSMRDWHNEDNQYYPLTIWMSIFSFNFVNRDWAWHLQAQYYLWPQAPP